MPTAPTVIAHRTMQMQQQNIHNAIQQPHASAECRNANTDGTEERHANKRTLAANIKRKISTKIGEEEVDRMCCFGSIHLRYAAIGLSIFELFVLTYQLIVSSLELFVPSESDDLFPNPPPNSIVPSLLTILSIVLAITSVVLLLLGVIFRSPYFLMPHLLMQFALMIATLVIFCYLLFWLFGGINVQINAIFFENSSRGVRGFLTAKERPSINAELSADGLQIIVLLLLFATSAVFCLQLVLFRLVFATFRLLLISSKFVVSSPAESADKSDATDTCTTVMMMSTVSSRNSPNNNPKAPISRNGCVPPPVTEHPHPPQPQLQPPPLRHLF